MNPIKGEVRLTLADGRELTLVMDMEALVVAEATYGKPLVATMMDLLADYIGASRAFLYGALRAHHPEVTLRMAGELLLSDGTAIKLALEQALLASQQESTGPAEGKESPNPPGKRSGRSGARPASSPKRSGARRPASSPPS